MRALREDEGGNPTPATVAPIWDPGSSFHAEPPSLAAADQKWDSPTVSSSPPVGERGAPAPGRGKIADDVAMRRVLGLATESDWATESWFRLPVGGGMRGVGSSLLLLLLLRGCFGVRQSKTLRSCGRRNGSCMGIPMDGDSSPCAADCG